MADHSGPPNNPSDQDELKIKSEEELAAKLEEGGNAPEQQQSFYLTLALGFGLTTHALEVRSSLNLLKKPLDLDKLFTDSAYKAQVERAVELTNRYGRFVKKGELAEKVPKIEQTLKRVKNAHDQIYTTQTNFSHNNDAQLRNIYGLNDGQLKAVREKALAKFKENPGGLTMTELLRNEARNEILHTTEEAVKKDPNVKRNKRNEEIKKRLDAKDQQFLNHPYTENILKNEKDLTVRTLTRGKQSVAQTLGQQLKPEELEILNQPLDKIITPPQPAPNVIPPIPSGGIGGLKKLFNSLRSIFNLENLQKWGSKIISSALALGSAIATAGIAPIVGFLAKNLGWGLIKSLLSRLNPFSQSGNINQQASPGFLGRFSKDVLIAFAVCAAVVGLVFMGFLMGGQTPAPPAAGQSVQMQ